MEATRLSSDTAGAGGCGARTGRFTRLDYLERFSLWGSTGLIYCALYFVTSSTTTTTKVRVALTALHALARRACFPDPRMTIAARPGAGAHDHGDRDLQLLHHRNHGAPGERLAWWRACRVERAVSWWRSLRPAHHRGARSPSAQILKEFLWSTMRKMDMDKDGVVRRSPAIDRSPGSRVLAFVVLAHPDGLAPCLLAQLSEQDMRRYDRKITRKDKKADKVVFAIIRWLIKAMNSKRFLRCAGGE